MHRGEITPTRRRAGLGRYVGRRGAVLLVMAGADAVYGFALISTLGVSEVPNWWPASVGHVGTIAVSTWGIVWLAVALLLIVGSLRRAPDWAQFGAQLGLLSWWAFAALLNWIDNPSPGSWGPAAIYAGLAGLVLITAGWEEPP